LAIAFLFQCSIKLDSLCHLPTLLSRRINVG
jgi:hypothetical protein